VTVIDGPFKHPGIYKKTPDRRLHCRAGHRPHAPWRALCIRRVAVYTGGIRIGIFPCHRIVRHVGMVLRWRIKIVF